MATALLRGDLDVMFEFFTAVHGLIDDKKVVALASTGPKRNVLSAGRADRRRRPASRTSRC